MDSRWIYREKVDVVTSDVAVLRVFFKMRLLKWNRRVMFRVRTVRYSMMFGTRL